MAKEQPQTPSLAVKAETVTQEDLNKWYKLHEELEDIKNQELMLRRKIFGAYFTNPKEGVNNVPLSEGWILKGEYKINRSVDVASLTTHSAELRVHNIPLDDLIKYKPEVVIAEYRKLNPEERLMFDSVLVIKVGTPGLEIVLPKRIA